MSLSSSSVDESIGSTLAAVVLVSCSISNIEWPTYARRLYLLTSADPCTIADALRPTSLLNLLDLQWLL
jgi:hypothetical protein